MESGRILLSINADVLSWTADLNDHILVFKKTHSVSLPTILIAPSTNCKYILKWRNSIYKRDPVYMMPKYYTNWKKNKIIIQAFLPTKNQYLMLFVIRHTGQDWWEPIRKNIIIFCTFDIENYTTITMNSTIGWF